MDMTDYPMDSDTSPPPQRDRPVVPSEPHEPTIVDAILIIGSLCALIYWLA